MSVDSFKGFSEAGTVGDLLTGVKGFEVSLARFTRGVVVHAASMCGMVGLLPLRVRFLLGPGDVVVGGVEVEVDAVGWDSKYRVE